MKENYKFQKLSYIQGFFYYPFGMMMPNRSYSAGSRYRYGFNGKENDNDPKGIGNQQDYGMRIYDPRLGRFLSIDPLTPKYPWLTPYQFASDNPIAFIDIDGLEAGKKGTVNSTNTHYTDEDLKTALNANTTRATTGVTVDYMLSAASMETLSLKMYDRDGDKVRGGNTTIGFGIVVHYGSIGNKHYDADALEKEEKYKDGITFDQAVNMFVDGLNAIVPNLNNFYKQYKIDQSKMTDREKDVMMDIYFNSGTKNIKKAMAAYAKNGKKGLIDAIEKGTVGSISKERKNMRLDILNDKTYPIKPRTPSKPEKKPEPAKQETFLEWLKKQPIIIDGIDMRTGKPPQNNML